MIRRICQAVLLAGVLLAPPSPARPSGAPSPSAGSALADEPANVPPIGSPEHNCLDALREPGLSHESAAVWLRELGRCGESRSAVRELIRWLEYSPDDHPPSEHRGRIWVNNAAMPRRCPAQYALMIMGPIAAPQLVEEYVLFFENTSPKAWNGRFAMHAIDETGKLFETQSPAYRLSSLAVVLASSREMASKTVEVATERMRKEAWNDRTVRACRELIASIKAQFPEAEHPKLFPAAILAQ